MLLFTLYKSTWLTAISSHCLAALSATDVCVQQEGCQIFSVTYAKILNKNGQNSCFWKRYSEKYKIFQRW